MSLESVRRTLEQRKGLRDRIASSLEESRLAVGTRRRLQRNLERAQAVLQQVARQTQEELEYHVSEIVTLALATVFEEDPYEFRIEFVQRRERTEADLLFVRESVRVDPLSAAGGGPADVASSALRVALWRLQCPRSRPLLILDEPFRFLSRELQPRASALLRELSRRLSLQILMVSHSPDLIEEADRVFGVSLKKGISQVTGR